MLPSDIESLFTYVPIDTAVEAVLQKLENDPSLTERSMLTPAQIADLLNLVMRSRYSQYNKSIYKNQEGTAIGSWFLLLLLSFEEQAIGTSPYKPRILKAMWTPPTTS